MANFFKKYWFLLLIVAIGGYYFYSQKGPCEVPLTYRIGTFDTSFGVSKADFLKALQDAAALWEKPIGKKLFSYDQNGQMPVNLIYDDRQKTTEKNKVLKANIDENSAVADSVKEEYDALESRYKSAKQAYDAEVTAFNQMLTDYNSKIEYWNSRGGAPQNEYEALTAEKNALALKRNALQEAQSRVNDLAAQMNALIDKYQSLAHYINSTVSTVNQTAGKEFNEGEYIEDDRGALINIYEFTDRAKLVRVLAHELGHALGLEHNSNPAAIMYALNQSKNIKLTPEDLAALKTRCGIK